MTRNSAGWFRWACDERQLATVCNETLIVLVESDLSCCCSKRRGSLGIVNRDGEWPTLEGDIQLRREEAAARSALCMFREF